VKKKLSLAFLFLVSIIASFFIGNSLQKEKLAAADQVIDSISADLDVANEVISVLKTENISHLESIKKLKYQLEEQEVKFIIMRNKNMKKVRLSTTYGDIIVALDFENAPISSENFINYINDGFYNDTIFHRVISGFMIQGGGHLEDMTPKDDKLDPIRNEANNGLRNDRGTIAMARTQDPHSATSQFFINHKDNEFLNFTTDQFDQGWGYAVFGKVTEGFDVLDKIAEVKTTTVQGYQDVPVETIKILEAEVID
tara:strand:- start:69 stop:833 length:765 start_codon:yes stop_codon:yes gene_type:complete